MNLFCCTQISHSEIWVLKDIKDFTERKIAYAICPKCREAVITLVEKRISDGKVFVNENIKGINAVKTLYREKKRVIAQIPFVKVSDLYGWIYGTNKEIKNKKGEITQIRQYATDFSNKKKLVKKVINNGS